MFVVNWHQSVSLSKCKMWQLSSLINAFCNRLTEQIAIVLFVLCENEYSIRPVRALITKECSQKMCNSCGNIVEIGVNGMV